LACRDHRAHGGVARNEEDLGLEVVWGAKAADQHSVVGQPQQDSHHLQDHSQPPQRPGKPGGDARGHGSARVLLLANQHASVLGRTGWFIRGALSYPAVVVRLGLLDTMLTWDRPGIVTDFVTTCPAS
jgi:hypothetical protein